MKRIHFEDQGQDFLTWDVDESGEVVDSQPFQKSVWQRHKVFNHGNIAKGDRVILITKEKPPRYLEVKYKIEKVETIKDYD